MPEYGLGRIAAPDERDHRFLLPTRRPEAKAIVRKTWTAAGVLDQGSYPACVGYSTWMFLAASPVRNKPAFSPLDLYHEAQTLDEWPGEDYDGTSVRGAFKALQKRGLVSNYLWAFGCEAVIDHVLAPNGGPVVMGTDWHERMFEPTDQGYLIPDGPVVGGHAWLILGADREHKNPDGTIGRVRMLNSWGRNWGQNGRAYLSFAHLDQLIKAQGEAAVAQEVLVK